MANTKIGTNLIKQHYQLPTRPYISAPIQPSPIQTLKTIGILSAKGRNNQTFKQNTMNIKRKRRSPMMRKAIQPIQTPPKQKSKAGVSRRGHTNTLPESVNKKLIIIQNTVEQQTNKKSLLKSKNMKLKKPNCQLRKLASVGGDACYSNGQQGKLSRRQQISAASPPQSLLPTLDGVGAQKTEAHNAYGYKTAASVRPAQKPDNLIVPLSNRLPIIDFISTDEFERLRNFKMKQKKRSPTDGGRSVERLRSKYS